MKSRHLLALGLRAEGCLFIALQTISKEIDMNSRFRKLGVESLEGRSVLSTVAYGDFNHDGRLDMAAVTGQKTITVSLANPDSGYTVSAILTAPKQITAIAVTDVFSDGNWDIQATGPKSSDYFFWMGNGDGTFDYLEPWRVKKTHGGTW